MHGRLLCGSYPRGACKLCPGIDGTGNGDQ